MVVEADDTALAGMDLSEGVYCVDFWAEWCEACKLVAPAFEKAAAAVEGVKFLKVDADRSPVAAEKFGVRGLPTIVVIRGGQVIARKTGMVSAGQIKNLLATSKST